MVSLKKLLLAFSSLLFSQTLIKATNHRQIKSANVWELNKGDKKKNPFLILPIRHLIFLYLIGNAPESVLRQQMGYWIKHPRLNLQKQVIPNFDYAVFICGCFDLQGDIILLTEKALLYQSKAS